MLSTDLTTTLGPDTCAWLQAMATPGLKPSHYRCLIVLREINCSASTLAHLTGLKGPRCRQRLRELQDKGLVRVTEVLSDRTQIWGLVGDIARDGVDSYPTEAVVQERRSKVQYGVPVLDPTVQKVRTTTSRKTHEVVKVDADLLKLYEAKHET